MEELRTVVHCTMCRTLTMYCIHQTDTGDRSGNQSESIQMRFLSGRNAHYTNRGVSVDTVGMSVYMQYQCGSHLQTMFYHIVTTACGFASFHMLDLVHSVL